MNFKLKKSLLKNISFNIFKRAVIIVQLFRFVLFMSVVNYKFCAL